MKAIPDQGGRSAVGVASTLAAVSMLVGGLACTSVSALSSMGTALVSTSGGQPCFGVPPGGPGSSAPTQLQSLVITAVPAAGAAPPGDWRQLPPELWGFNVEPPGLPLDTASGACIRYGDLPAAARSRAEPGLLLPGKTYRVEMTARPAEGPGSTRAFQVDFCLKPAAGNGPLEARAVPWDEAARRWRSEVCIAP